MITQSEGALPLRPREFTAARATLCGRVARVEPVVRP